jgi:coenzyme F420-reducing hydrogenase delta subunit
MGAFTPRIVAFCCDQSGGPALEMARTLGLALPPGLEVVAVPCSGRIETPSLLKALEEGADGVVVFACHEENCQSLKGNRRVRGRLDYARQMLERIGLEKERLEICPLATNSGPKLAETLRRKAKELETLGPIMKKS